MWLDLGEYRGPGRFHAFVSYCVARARRRGIDRAYRTYVTESLRAIPKGEYMTRSFEDTIRPREKIDVDATIERVIRGLEA